SPRGPPLLPYTTLFRSQPSCSATKYMSKMPAQNAGMEIAERAKTELSASTKPPRLTAERIPSGTPTDSEKNSDTRAICRVTGNRSEEHTSELQSRENLV